MPEFVQYALFDSPPNGIDISSISMLDIMTTVNPSTLCQEGVTYEVTYDDTPITTSSVPLSLSAPIDGLDDSFTLKLFSDDQAQSGYHEIYVRASLPFVPPEPPFPSFRRLQAAPSGAYGTPPVN